MSMVERVAEAIERCESRWSAEHLARAAIAAMLEGRMTDHQRAMKSAETAYREIAGVCVPVALKAAITAYLAAIGVVVDESNIQ